MRIFFLIAICFSCEQGDEMREEQEAQTLIEMFNEIENLASSVSCFDSTEWNFSSYGSKPCGGPKGFIAYSKKIDTTLFLKKIEEHKIREKEYNEQWGIASDCMYVSTPIIVKCENGNPVLEY